MALYFSTVISMDFFIGFYTVKHCCPV
jgi:hypothetical protein